jgi:hypothetical protein
VEVAEEFADGRATSEELMTAYYQANVACAVADVADFAAVRASHLASSIAYTAVFHGATCTSEAATAVADSVADGAALLRKDGAAFVLHMPMHDGIPTVHAEAKVLAESTLGCPRKAEVSIEPGRYRWTNVR